MPIPLLPPLGGPLEITPAGIGSGAVVPGPHGLGTALVISPAAIPTGADVPGPHALPHPDLRESVKPMPIASGVIVPGPTVLRSSSDADEWTMPAGPATVSRAIRVTNYPNATAIEARPRLNEIGSGSFTTTPPRPAEDELVGVDVGPRRVFTGHAARITDVRRAKREEVEQLVTVELDGLLAEWQQAVVLPDFGASDLSRLGPPTQDTRVFDWTMNGLGTDDPDDLPAPRLRDSVAITNAYGTAGEVFPMPDVWPAPYARWMWVANPARPQPRGFCHFRIPFGVPATTRRIQVWCCAYDWADVWLDGVPILTCETPGEAQRIQLDVRSDFHNLTIRAYNDAGNAGLLVAVVPIGSDGLYGEPIRQSGGGWKCLAYPSRTFRLNPGQVLRRLREEAQRRGVAFMDGWQFTFNASRDSAGRPWPDNDPISVQVGTTYLDVLNQLSESLIDWAAAPAGRVLEAWVKDAGTGVDRDQPWVDGVNLTSRAIRRVVR